MHANGEKSLSGLTALGFAALGVVFGDIGTSPLYTLKTVLDLSRDPGPLQVFGVLSLIIWTLLAITSVKYVTVAMRVDNDGEGGILALMALLGVKRQQRPAIVALGLAGAALIYGDGAITPAISVLSALEGLTITEPALEPYVLPIAVGILIGLFAIQSQGTARIGRAFGREVCLDCLRRFLVPIELSGRADGVRVGRVRILTRTRQHGKRARYGEVQGTLHGRDSRRGQRALEREVRRLAGRETLGEVDLGRVGQRRVGDERGPGPFVAGGTERAVRGSRPGAVVRAADPAAVESGQVGSRLGHGHGVDRLVRVVDDSHRGAVAVKRSGGRASLGADRSVGVDDEQDLAAGRLADGRAARDARSRGARGPYRCG